MLFDLLNIKYIDPSKRIDKLSMIIKTRTRLRSIIKTSLLVTCYTTGIYTCKAGNYVKTNYTASLSGAV